MTSFVYLVPLDRANSVKILDWKGMSKLLTFKGVKYLNKSLSVSLSPSLYGCVCVCVCVCARVCECTHKVNAKYMTRQTLAVSPRKLYTDNIYIAQIFMQHNEIPKKGH